MNTKESRRVFNLAISKKGNRFDIVRYNNGFDNQPDIILKNICKEDLQAKFNRAIELIGSTMKEWGVFLRPDSRNRLVELVLIIEDSGINTSDIKIQENGLIYFKTKGETDETTEKNVESVLRDGGFEYNEDTITIVRGDAILPDKSASVNEIGFEYPSTNTVYQKTTKDNIDTKIDPQPPFDEREKQEYEALKLYPVLQENPELKARFDYLNKKYGYVQHSPSIDSNDIDPIERVEPKVDKVEVYLERLTKNFSSAQELLQDMITNGISVEEIKEFNKSNPKELAKHIG